MRYSVVDVQRDDRGIVGSGVIGSQRRQLSLQLSQLLSERLLSQRLEPAGSIQNAATRLAAIVHEERLQAVSVEYDGVAGIKRNLDHLELCVAADA